MKRIKELLKKIRDANKIYMVVDNQRKIRIFDLCSKTFGELVSLTNKERGFYEALLIWGKEFLLAEYGTEEEQIFGSFKKDLSQADWNILTIEKEKNKNKGEQVDLI